MNTAANDYVRFEAIRIRDYGIFEGTTDFIFNDGCTVIVGKSGSGKTTLFNALAHLGRDSKVQENLRSGSNFSLVQVWTNGNRDLIKSYRQLIFVDDDSVYAFGTENMDRLADHLCCTGRTTDLETSTWEIFNRLVGVWSRQKTNLANKKTWALGERIAYGFACVFAARSILRVDLPLVLDAPFGMLDSARRAEMSTYLKYLGGQQILILQTSQSQEYGCNFRLPDRAAPTATL